MTEKRAEPNERDREVVNEILRQMSRVDCDLNSVIAAYSEEIETQVRREAYRCDGCGCLPPAPDDGSCGCGGQGMLGMLTRLREVLHLAQTVGVTEASREGARQALYALSEAKRALNAWITPTTGMDSNIVQEGRGRTGLALREIEKAVRALAEPEPMDYPGQALAERLSEDPQEPEATKAEPPRRYSTLDQSLDIHALPLGHPYYSDEPFEGCGWYYGAGSYCNKPEAAHRAESFTCPECGLKWLDGRRVCKHTCEPGDKVEFPE